MEIAVDMSIAMEAYFKQNKYNMFITNTAMYICITSVSVNAKNGTLRYYEQQSIVNTYKTSKYTCICKAAIKLGGHFTKPWKYMSLQTLYSYGT